MKKLKKLTGILLASTLTLMLFMSVPALPVQAASWWNAGWDYRNVLSFNATALTENLTNFPVTIFLNPSRVDFDKIAANGTDIRFVDKDDVTPLPFHITQWNDTPGSENATVVVTVNVTAYSNYSDYIYMYYGNAIAADGQDKNAVWASTNATAVLPLYTDNNSGTIIYDSTSYGNNGTEGTSTWSALGRTFNGVNAKIDCGNGASLTTGNVSVDLWVKSPIEWNLQGNYTDIIGKMPAAATTGWTVFCYGAAGDTIYFRIGDAATQWVNLATFAIDTWYHLAFTYDGVTIRGYVDGSEDYAPKAFAGTVNACAENLLLGNGYAVPANFFTGIIGEARVYGRPLSAEEIRCSNLSEQYFYTGLDGGFIYYGNEDPPPTMTTLTAHGITMDKDGVTGGTFNGTLVSLGGAPSANVSFEYGLLGTLTGETAAQVLTVTGNYTTAVPATLTPGAVYQYRAKGTNVDGSGYGGNVTFTFTMPSITTSTASGVTMDKDAVTGGNFRGNITNMGVASDTYAHAEYGLTAAYGSNTSAVTRDVTGLFSVSIPNDLTPGETYHYRIVIENDPTIVLGSDQTFVFTMPSITTNAATNKGANGGTRATLNANISDMGVASNTYAYFEWGYSTSYGSTVGVQTLDLAGAYSYVLEHFTPSKTVHYRSVVRIGNDSTYVYGSDQSFSVSTTTFSLALLISVVFAIFGIVVLFALRGKPIAMVIAGVLIAIGIIIIQNVVGALW